MILRDLVLALLVAFILSAAFALTNRTPDRRRSGLLWLFLLMFLGTWAGGVWVQPLCPATWGGHWLVFLAIGFVIALIFAAMSHRRSPGSRHETLDMLDSVEAKKEVQAATYITLSLFFWVLLAFLLLAIIIRYIL
ncbi:MAG: hypothetical protein ACOWYE_01445 [Desulfatiglandales bacterium]